MIFFIFAENLTMKKEIGKWFMDIAKYVATAVIISSFLGGFEQKWAMYVAGFTTIAFSFIMGISLLKEKKETKKITKK